MQEKLDTNSKISFGARLRALRLQSAHPSATAFAKACGISRATLYLWEDSTTPPPAKHWDQLCAVLGISQQHLLLGTTGVSNYAQHGVHEESTPYSKENFSAVAHNLVDEALQAAGNDTARKGWIVEQLRLHLRPPSHWTMLDAQPTESLLVQRGLRQMTEYRDQLRADAAARKKANSPDQTYKQKSA